jgi:hypothetical protein
MGDGIDMGSLLRDVLSFAAGTGFEFSFVAWALLTLLLAGVGSVMILALPQLFEPMAIEVALRPGRVALWIPISLIAVPLVLLFFMASIVASPLSVVVAFLIAIGTVFGYMSVAYVTGDRITRAAGHELPPVAAFLVGLILIRLIRLIPVIGAFVHSIVVLVALAATCAVGWDLVRSWHKRRLPDDVQFQNERLIEWNPPDENAPPPSR